MRNVSEKVVEKIKTHSLFSKTFLPRKSCLFSHNVNKYTAEPVSPQITIGRMRHAMEIPKSPNTLSRNM